MKASGLVTVAQPRKRLPDGAWKGLAAVKAISRHLFAVFGLDRRLKKERAKASKRLKQKTAYEMLRSLVGSEMCIRDRWLD